jgi:hypothetical protein
MKHARVPFAIFLATVLLSFALITGCEEGTGPTLAGGRDVAIVLSSTDRSITVFDVDSAAQPVTLGVGPDGSPVTLAVRGRMLVVPLGIVPAAVVIDLVQQRTVHTIALPASSGATGAAFLNDSIALIGNPVRGTVTPVNVARGTAGQEIAVGIYPQAMTAVRDTVFVVNANLIDFEPAGPSSISVITDTPPRVVATIELSGRNAGAAAAAADGRLYVLHSGSFGAAEGSISIIDRGTLAETDHVTGFGDFPGGIAVDPARRVYVGAFAYGLAVWDAATRTFVRSPANAVEPGNVASVSGVGIDDAGRLYTLRPDCRAPASAYRLTPNFLVEREFPTGICPIAIVFTKLP